MTKIHVNTSPFFNMYLKQPRGFGNWAFGINGNIYFFCGTYTFAKKEAIAMARVLGAHSIRVES